MNSDTVPSEAAALREVVRGKYGQAAIRAAHAGAGGGRGGSAFVRARKP
jgi:hypothetical protein